MHGDCDTSEAMRTRDFGGGGGEGPTLIALAVGTCLVVIEFQQVLDGLLVLSSLRRGRAARHNHSRKGAG